MIFPTSYSSWPPPDCGSAKRAVQRADIGLDEGTVEVRGTVLRLRAGGLVIKPSPKSAAGRRILELPSWAVIMLRRRHAGSVVEGELARQVSPHRSLVVYATRPTP